MEQAYGRGPKAMAGDRGFDQAVNRVGLAADGISNAVCPRNPRQLRQRNRYARTSPETNSRMSQSMG